MDTEEAIKSRRSVREYTDKAIDKDTINSIINAGILAPSAMNRQPWKFIAITDKDMIKKLSDAVLKEGKKRFPEHRFREMGDPIFYNAPLVVFILGKKEERWADLDSAFAAENMMVYACSRGIGSCVIGFAKFLEERVELIKEIGVPEDYRIAVPLVFGYPPKFPDQPERKKADVSWIE